MITARFVAGSALIGQVGLGLLIAWAFYRKKGFLREAVYTLVILAWIIPETVVAFTWVAYLDWEFGTLNTILDAVGLGRPDWLFDYPLESIILFNSWRGAAFSMLLFSSALETIPPSYIETAEVVGANAWQKFRDIFFPLLRPTSVAVAMLLLFNAFQAFDEFYNTLNTVGGYPPYARPPLVYLYLISFGSGAQDLGIGSAGTMKRTAANLRWVRLGINSKNYENFWYDDVKVTPEPASLLLLGLGGLLIRRRRA